MVDMMYLNDKKNTDYFKDVCRVDYSPHIVDLANEINNNKIWIPFGRQDDINGNIFYYYQNEISHCNARIGVRSNETFSIKFSFVEEKVLKETLQKLGLPTDKF